LKTTKDEKRHIISKVLIVNRKQETYNSAITKTKYSFQQSKK